MPIFRIGYLINYPAGSCGVSQDRQFLYEASCWDLDPERINQRRDELTSFQMKGSVLVLAGA